MIQGWLLAAVAFGLLLIATATGAWLRRRDAHSDLAADWNAQADSWWSMTFILGAFLLGGFWGIFALFAFLSFAALREFVSIGYVDRSDHWAWAAVFFGVLPAQYVFVAFDQTPLYTMFIPIYGLVLVPVVSVVTGRTRKFLARVGGLQMAMMVCIYGVSHVPAVAGLPLRDGDPLFLVAFLAIVTQGATTLQYLFGTLFGATPIAPALSARKTWEGFAGAVASAGVLGLAFWWLTPFSPLLAAVLALVSVLAGLLAGLVMSAIKRDAGIRDWGHALPGRGGFLDMLDPVVFAAPVFFHLAAHYGV